MIYMYIIREHLEILKVEQKILMVNEMSQIQNQK